MPLENLNQVFEALLGTTRESDVRTILSNLGDHADVGVDENFGPFGLCWHPFGNNPSNISSINLGTKPGRSLTERITNATDALLEDRVILDVTRPRSASEAA